MSFKYSLKVRNYKCFGDEPQGFERVFPINVIIGRNSAGKSSIIDVVEEVTGPKEALLTESAQVICTVFPDEAFWKEVAHSYERASNAEVGSWIPSVMKWVEENKLMEPIELQYFADKQAVILSNSVLGQYEDAVRSILANEINQKSFRKINAERDIVPENPNAMESVRNGGGVTNVLWKFMTERRYNQDIVKKDLLKALNKIVNPDMEFRDISVRQDRGINGDNQQGKYEIEFEIADRSWVNLSKMGSGVKTIILVLVHLIVLPERDRMPINRCIFAFEEIENNLHPSLQRRLFAFIAEFAVAKSTSFFLTTHSNVVIDMFSSKPYAQIVHVERKAGLSKVTSVVSTQSSRQILMDLDYKASDLLLSNGVIWVEGPSDIIYLHLWLQLYRYKENINNELNYCIQPLSTASWKVAGFSDFNWNSWNDGLENNIVSLARLNHNNIIVLDRDGDYDDLPPSRFSEFRHGTGRNKARLIHHSMSFAAIPESSLINNFGQTKDGSLAFWVNEGTVEGYLSYFLLNKGRDFAKYFENIHSEEMLRKISAGVNSSKSKVDLASEIGRCIVENELRWDDVAPDGSLLAIKVRSLWKTIQNWND